MFWVLRSYIHIACSMYHYYMYIRYKAIRRFTVYIYILTGFFSNKLLIWWGSEFGNFDSCTWKTIKSWQNENWKISDHFPPFGWGARWSCDFDITSPFFCDAIFKFFSNFLSDSCFSYKNLDWLFFAFRNSQNSAHRGGFSKRCFWENLKWSTKLNGLTDLHGIFFIITVIFIRLCTCILVTLGLQGAELGGAKLNPYFILINVT